MIGLAAIRAISALVLALCLALSSGAMAISRTAPGAVGFVILCTGDGPRQVPVGPDGQPMEPGHLCPDCTHAIAAAILPPAPLVPGPRVLRAATVLPAPQLAALSRAPLAPTARGPPLVA